MVKGKEMAVTSTRSTRSTTPARGRRELITFEASSGFYLLLIVGSAKKNPPSSTLRPERMTRPRVASSTINEPRGRRSRGLSLEVTKDVEMDTDDLVMEAEPTKPDKKFRSSQRTNQILSAKTTLKEVMIPSPPFQIPSDHGKSIPPSQSPSSNGSALSSVRGQSSGYDTPGTSTAVTPAESLGRRGSLTGISRKTGRGRPMGQLARIGVHSKRKHEDILGDALLAQALQEEEYREGKLAPKRRRTIAVEDSEDEDPSLSDVDDVDPVEAGHQSSEKMKIGGRLSLPTRVARESAIKSMTNKVPQEVMDTESDDSELSEYNTDEDVEDFDTFDASEDEISGFGSTAPGEADAGTAMVASNLPAAASIVRRHGRRMAPPATAGRNRNFRNRLPHDSRVSILHPLDHGFQLLKFFRPSASVGNLKLLIPRSRLCGKH